MATRETTTRAQSYHANALQGHTSPRMSYRDSEDIETKELALLKSKLGGKIPVKVYFLDNSSKTFLCDRGTTFKSLSVEILKKLGDEKAESNARLMGIYQTDGGVMGTAGAPDQSVADMVISYGDDNLRTEKKKLVFMIRLFTPMLQTLDSPQVGWDLRLTAASPCLAPQRPFPPPSWFTCGTSRPCTT